MQRATERGSIGRTGHKADFQSVGGLIQFRKHQDVNRVVIIAIDAQGIAILAIAVGVRVGEEFQTVEVAGSEKAPAGQGGVAGVHIYKLAEILVIGDGNRTAAGAEGRFGSIRNGVVVADSAYAYHVARIGLKIVESVAVAMDFSAISIGIDHIMVGVVGVGDGDVR